MISRPEPDEYAPFYGGYIAETGSTDALELQRTQLEQLGALFGGIPESNGTHRYAAGKWSIREMIGHLADTERIMSYRALRLARADATPLSGFDENSFVAGADFDRRTLASLAEEWRAVRQASIALFASVGPEVAARRGTVNNGPMSVRALAYIIPGHAAHHVKVLRARYGID